MRCLSVDRAEATVATELVPVTDAELERLAQKGGPTSVEARIVEELREQRAKDRQVFAFKVGEYYFTGPTPDATTEIALLDLAEDDEE
jgi:hypothetical protein